MNVFMIKVALCFVVIFIVNASTNKLQECLNNENSTATLVLPNDENYARYNHQFDVRNLIYPSGFIVVNSSYDVKVAIDCSRKMNLSLTSKCRGHSDEKYSFKDNQTWVIELSNLKFVKINHSEMTADIGAGITLHELSKHLWENGKLKAVVGTCFSVGISGFSLGGGHGTTSRKYGLMLDNVKEIELVTADGKIQNVNENKSEELFWALRGAGGGNFGVATRFKIKLFDASHPVVTILKNYDLENFADIFYKWQLWVETNPDSSITSILQTNADSSNIRLAFVITPDSVSKRNQLLNEMIKVFPNISDQDIFITDYMKNLELISLPEYSSDFKMLIKTKNFFVSKILAFNETLKFADLIKTYRCELYVAMYGGKINEAKPSDTAFFHRTTYYDLQYNINFKVENDANYEKILREKQKIEGNMRKLQENFDFMDSGYSYGNQPDLDMVDWEQRYYGSNYQRLQAVKRLVDPLNFFNFAQSIRF